MTFSVRVHKSWLRPLIQAISSRHPFACSSLRKAAMNLTQARRRLFELELRRQHEEAVGPRPAEAEAGADWDQRRMQADHDLERTLEQERLRQVRGLGARPCDQPCASLTALPLL